MKFTSKASFVGFLIAISTLGASVAQANQTQPEDSNLTIEKRLSRLTEAIKQRNIEIQEIPENSDPQLMAGWLNGGGGGWIRTYRPSWINGGGGGWINRAWRDGGRFYRY